jgi:hypothetical protein
MIDGCRFTSYCISHPYYKSILFSPRVRISNPFSAIPYAATIYFCRSGNGVNIPGPCGLLVSDTLILTGFVLALYNTTTYQKQKLYYEYRKII